MGTVRNMVILLLGVGLALSLFSGVLAQTPPVVYVDIYEVEGLTLDGFIPFVVTDLVIPVRFENIDQVRTSITNGFKIVTSPGVTYDSMTGAWNAQYPWDLEMAFALMQFPPWFVEDLSISYYENGLAFSGLAGETGYGLPMFFEDVAYTITIWGVIGECDDWLTLDSVNFIPPDIDPAWTWDGSEINVAWGGPYEFEFWHCWHPYPHTYCWPQPTILKALDNERVLAVHVVDGLNVLEDIDLTSVRVNGIPPYTEARIIGGELVTDVFIMRFLGASGFRPIPPEGVQSTYTITYDYLYGGSEWLVGDYVLQVYPADVTLDGIADINDVQFMADYFWRGGPECQIDGEILYEFMDVDGSGRVDIQDAIKVIEIVGI